MLLTPIKSRFSKNKSGYTIVEVMIVLAVSGMLLAVALTVFRGTSQKTQFEQAVNDLSSKIENSIRDVSNEVFPESTQYKCSFGPTLTPLSAGASQAQSTNQDCIYLGKMFVIHPGTTNMDIYAVLGNRKCNGPSNSSCPAGQIATQFIDTYPTPASNIGGEIKETYTLNSSGAKFEKATVTNDNKDDDYAGFFNGIGTSAQAVATSGAVNLLSRAYAFCPNDATGTTCNRTAGISDVSFLNCLRTDTSCIDATALTNAKSWQICVAAGSDPALRGLVTVSAASSTVTSTVKIRGC